MCKSLHIGDLFANKAHVDASFLYVAKRKYIAAALMYHPGSLTGQVKKKELCLLLAHAIQFYCAESLEVKPFK
jgi:hypothetical protein